MGEAMMQEVTERLKGYRINLPLRSMRWLDESSVMLEAVKTDYRADNSYLGWTFTALFEAVSDRFRGVIKPIVLTMGIGDYRMMTLDLGKLLNLIVDNFEPKLLIEVESQLMKRGVRDAAKYGPVGGLDQLQRMQDSLGIPENGILGSVMDGAKSASYAQMMEAEQDAQRASLQQALMNKMTESKLREDGTWENTSTGALTREMIEDTRKTLIVPKYIESLARELVEKPKPIEKPMVNIKRPKRRIRLDD